MIFIADAANGHSLSWLQNLDRDSRHSGGNTDFQKTLAAEELPTTQITLEVGQSAEQQETRTALMAQGSAQVAGAATMLARAQSYFAEQISVQQDAQADTSDQSSKLGNYTMIGGEFNYQNEEGEWVTAELSTQDTLAEFEGGIVPAPDRKAMLLSVLNSLVFGTPLNEEAKQYLTGPGTFMGLLEIPQDELEYAQNNPDYVLDTPLGKMTFEAPTVLRRGILLDQKAAFCRRAL